MSPENVAAACRATDSVMRDELKCKAFNTWRWQHLAHDEAMARTKFFDGDILRDPSLELAVFLGASR